MSDARRQETTTFDEICGTYVPLLSVIATRKFGVPQDDVDELVHGVLETYLTHASRVREVEPYLIGAIGYAARQYWREAETEAAAVGPVPRSAIVAVALARLEPSCRETLRRFFLGGESVTSIAASLSTTPEAIDRLLNDCRTRIGAAYRSLEARLTAG